VLGLDEAVVHAVLKDWRTAPIDERLRAALGYLEKLTLDPDSLDCTDIAQLHAAGLTDTAIFEAGYVCFLFSTIDRLADAFDFTIPSAELVRNSGHFLNRFGYTMSKYTF
jgi:alkylhydroperoxidase family enzyme